MQRVCVTEMSVRAQQCQSTTHLNADVEEKSHRGTVYSIQHNHIATLMTRRASHPQYTMGILRSRIVDKGPGVQAG